ncbi:MAG TPA: hypothetical protein RMH80_22690, partial [Polyangiaceae bacterium LLY-WYZ-15_(1-7)]|nr:hypothetical protein [Polyangiaceae bacterium LLY-WYZ-15_(1-7)]
MSAAHRSWSRARWVEAAEAVLSDLRALLKPYGLAPDPELRVEADLHPCPGYTHDDRVIGFCPPVVERPADRIRWLVFRRLMGAADLDEAADFYALALPFVVCHEACHHLRMRGGLADESHFVEEQVCDRLAAAMVAEMPAHASTLAPLGAMAARLRDRLAERVEGAGWAFLPGESAVLEASRESLPPELAEELHGAASGELALEALLRLAPGIEEEDVEAAREARERARRLVDVDYARDPATYWHLSLTWIASYLGRGRRTSLDETVATFLQRRDDEVAELQLLEELARGGTAEQRRVAAGALLERFGEGVAHDLVDIALEGDAAPILEALRARWEPGWDPAPARRALRASGGEAAWRLAAAAGASTEGAPARGERAQLHQRAARGEALPAHPDPRTLAAFEAWGVRAKLDPRPGAPSEENDARLRVAEPAPAWWPHARGVLARSRHRPTLEAALRALALDPDELARALRLRGTPAWDAALAMELAPSPTTPTAAALHHALAAPGAADLRHAVAAQSLR